VKKNEEEQDGLEWNFLKNWKYDMQEYKLQ